MTREFKAHPLMVLSIIRPFLFIFLIPVIRGLVQYFILKEMSGIFGFEALLLIVIVVYAVLRCVNFRLICDKDCITLRTGVLVIKKAIIPVSKLSSVQSVKNPFDMILGCVTYKINTEAGVKNRTDYSFKLSRRDSEEISRLLYGKKELAPIKFSPLKIAVLAATASSAVTGILVAVPIINNAGRLLGIGLSEMLYNELSNVSNSLKTYFPPIVNMVSLIFLSGYLISFFYLFFKYLNFKLFLEQDNFEIRSGLFKRTRTSFKKTSVNNVKIEQSPLMLLINRFTMKVSVGGYGESKSESQVLVPSGKRSELERIFLDYFSFLKPQGENIGPKSNLITKNRFLFWSEVFLPLTVATSFIMLKKFEDFSRLIFFLTIIALSFIFVYSYLSLYEYKTGRVVFGDTVFANGRKRLRSYSLYCNKEKVGEIKLVRFLTDIHFKTCKLRITVCSEGADSIRLRNLDYKTVISQIYECYNITE